MLAYICILNISYPNRLQYLTVALIWISVMANNGEHLVKCIHTSSLLKYPYTFSPHFSTELLVSL